MSFALLCDATDAAAVAALAAKRASVEAEAAAHGFCAAAAPRPHAPPFAPQPSATPLTEMELRAAVVRRWRGGGWRRQRLRRGWSMLRRRWHAGSIAHNRSVV
jgi:hypothetical protein